MGVVLAAHDSAPEVCAGALECIARAGQGQAAALLVDLMTRIVRSHGTAHPTVALWGAQALALGLAAGAPRPGPARSAIEATPIGSNEDQRAAWARLAAAAAPALPADVAVPVGEHVIEVLLTLPLDHVGRTACFAALPSLLASAGAPLFADGARRGVPAAAVTAIASADDAMATAAAQCAVAWAEAVVPMVKGIIGSLLDSLRRHAAVPVLVQSVFQLLRATQSAGDAAVVASRRI